jgi:hypothetical protein
MALQRLHANSAQRGSSIWLRTNRRGVALFSCIQETTQQLNHAPATWFMCVHGLADQIQLRRLTRTQLRSAEYAFEQSQQEIALAANCPRAAISEMKYQRVGYHSGFQRPETFLKLHRSTPFQSGFEYRLEIAVPVFTIRDLFACNLPVTAARRGGRL